MTMPILLLSLVLNLLPVQGLFAISGSVRDSKGNIVSSIRVTILDENYQTLNTVFADNSGRFQFRNLREGVFLIRVETGGTPYEEVTQRIDLQSLSQRRATTEELF